MLQQTRMKFGVDVFCIFPVIFNLIIGLELLLEHINYMIFFNILTAYKKSALYFHCWKYSQNVYLPKSKEKQQYLTKLHQVTLLLENPVF